VATSHCQIGGLVRPCRNEPAQSCIYCGKAFCERHTHVVRGYEAVCTRKRCVQKQEDLTAHLEYRSRVSQRNAAGLCGVEECGPHPRMECSLCRGHFCAAHVQERPYPLREGRVVIDRPMSVCSWCWRRRKIWKH
jgi:hypothetical protein